MKVLISERNVDIRRLYEIIFSPYHARLTFVEDLEGAKSLLYRESFDLVLLELGFSDLDNLDEAGKFCRAFPGLPVLLVSSVPVSYQAERSFSASPWRALLMKPFEVSRLRELVERTTGLRPSEEGEAGKDAQTSFLPLEAVV